MTDTRQYGFGFPHRNKPLGLYPQPAPFTIGSKFVDEAYGNSRWTVSFYGSTFGEPYLLDAAGAWHDPRHCRVVVYVSAEEYEQQQQDALLDRLTMVYHL